MWLLDHVVTSSVSLLDQVVTPVSFCGSFRSGNDFCGSFISGSDSSLISVGFLYPVVTLV